MVCWRSRVGRVLLILLTILAILNTVYFFAISATGLEKGGEKSAKTVVRLGKFVQDGKQSFTKGNSRRHLVPWKRSCRFSVSGSRTFFEVLIYFCIAAGPTAVDFDSLFSKTGADTRVVSCVMPKLNPWQPAMATFYRKLEPLVCPGDNWVQVDQTGAVLSVTKEAEQRAGPVGVGIANNNLWFIQHCKSILQCTARAEEPLGLTR